MEASHPFAAVDALWNYTAVHVDGFGKGHWAQPKPVGIHLPLRRQRPKHGHTGYEPRRQRGREARGRQDSSGMLPEG